MKRFGKRLIVGLMALLMLCSLCITPAFAASGKESVQGNTGADKTFVVKVGSKDGKLTFTPIKGRLKCEQKFIKWKSTVKNYGMFQIIMENTKTGRRTWVTMYDHSQKMTLKANTTYRITVHPLNENLYSELSFCSFWSYRGWKTNAAWKVTGSQTITIQ